MGAAASLPAYLPDRIDKETCQNLSGSHFNEKLFDEEADQYGMITKHTFLLHFSDFRTKVKKLKDLSAEEVAILMESLELGSFTTAFLTKNVDGASLQACEDVNDLKELGITLVAKAKMFFREISSFRETGVPIELISKLK